MIVRGFLTALQFLTLIPVSGSTGEGLGKAAPAFPLVGAALGFFAGVIVLTLSPHLGSSIAALLALTFLTVITGGLHEDGLADVADAFRAGSSPQRILEILKDSRIGTYGGLALIVTFLLRWQSLVDVHAHQWEKLSAACALSRGAMVALGGMSKSVDGGLGANFIQSLTPATVGLTVLIAASIAVALTQLTGLLMVIVTGLTVLVARTYFHKRLGGVNGDCLGATCQLVETLNLLLLAGMSRG